MKRARTQRTNKIEILKKKKMSLQIKLSIRLTELCLCDCEYEYECMLDNKCTTTISICLLLYLFG